MTDNAPWDEAVRARLEEACSASEVLSHIYADAFTADLRAAVAQIDTLIAQLDAAEARALRAEEALTALKSDAWRMQGPRGMNVATFAARALAGEGEKG